MDKRIHSGDVYSICRLCGDTNELVLHNVFDEDDDGKIINDLIERYLKITITENESKLISDKLCSPCVQTLNSFHDFFEKCHRAQKNFIEILDKSELSCEDTQMDCDFSPATNVRRSKKTKRKIDTLRRRGRSANSTSRIPRLKIKIKREGVKKNPRRPYRPRDAKIKAFPDTGIPEIKEFNEDDSNDNSSEIDESNENVDDSSEDPKLSMLYRFDCNLCGINCKNYQSYARHCNEQHQTEAAVHCICGKVLHSRSAVGEHRRKHSGDTIYKCNVCAKTFNRKALLELHMVSHVPKEEQPFVCCKCAKRFHSVALLRKHERIHLPKEERFVKSCHICRKKFSSTSSVNAHMRAVHLGERPFVCDQCGSSFSSKGILLDHKITHSSERPWPCDSCDKCFKSKYRLKLHMDTHRLSKYDCPNCSQQLSTRRTLRMHMLVHKEEKGYSCTICGKAFRRSKDLKIHNNLHTGRKPYVCPFCNRAFANGSNCRAHKKRMHPDELALEECMGNNNNNKNKSNINSTQQLLRVLPVQEVNMKINENINMHMEFPNQRNTIQTTMVLHNNNSNIHNNHNRVIMNDVPSSSYPLDLNVKSRNVMESIPNMHYLSALHHEESCIQHSMMYMHHS